MKAGTAVLSGLRKADDETDWKEKEFRIGSPCRRSRRAGSEGLVRVMNPKT